MIDSQISMNKQGCVLLAAFSVCCMCTIRIKLCSSVSPPSLQALKVEGHLSFEGNDFAAKDFGNLIHFMPHAVLYPKGVSDIAETVKHVWRMDPASRLTVAARGHSHSLRGQAQAHKGIVINMESLRQEEMKVHRGKSPYVDVSAGELWINVLNKCLKYGLAPKSWTDYLHLTVGGTLSNAGISGQAFQHGPQISNVLQLEVVTGKGDVVICSKQKNADLFYGVLGGLGQFGIITRAQIPLQTAPQKVKWIRVLYSEFSDLARDQESLMLAENAFDFIEGLVIINRTGLVDNWRSSFEPDDLEQASRFISDGKTLFCLELAKNFNLHEAQEVEKEVRSLLSKLHFIPSMLFFAEVPYLDFMDRVHAAEKKLRLKGMWDLPHPWLSLIVPRSSIYRFAKGVFDDIITDTNNGPVLVYPLNRSKWDNRTSFVMPEEDIFYLVAFLAHPTENFGLEELLHANKNILSFCEAENLGVKQYLPYYTTEDDWKAHFGPRWEAFARRKSSYDPLSILAPGQRIFQKAKPGL